MCVSTWEIEFVSFACADVRAAATAAGESSCVRARGSVPTPAGLGELMMSAVARFPFQGFFFFSKGLGSREGEGVSQKAM